MKIAVNGYGRMGTLIRQVALERGHAVCAVIDPYVPLPEVTASALTAESIAEAEVVIDFTAPSTALQNIEIITSAGKNSVIGTTGWYESSEAVAKMTEAADTGLIWSGNFSLGVHLLFRILHHAGSLINSIPEYDAMIHEYHHAGKADSPSGTAGMLSDILLDTLDRKTRSVSDALNRTIEPEELHVSSTRGGKIPGTHRITFDSEVDTIEITHQARSRMGFALGAVKAAEWVGGKKGYFSIDDMMNAILQ